MRTFIYKTIIAAVLIVLVFEITIGRKFDQINNKVESFFTKEGRKEAVINLKKEIKKANEKENYLDEEERELLRNFILKIQRELGL
tara:strand:- start:307 stop:564 length:258 start_codon:yes stop_codon:yes gene_type:complete